jgi:hypothetical protein
MVNNNAAVVANSKVLNLSAEYFHSDNDDHKWGKMYLVEKEAKLF